MPFLFLLYVVAYLDRINVSFAVLEMRDPLGLTDRIYGRAAGMFFAGYFLFQLPSNFVLERVGVRRWIAFLMVAWGVISCLMIFIRGPISFYGARFLLGTAEAGFFPGIVLYMKRWFPAEARARAVAWFMAANPVSGIVGSPISGALLGLSGKGLAGWQWMFLMEGIPAIVLGAMVWWMLAESPRQATWLGEKERAWLLDSLAAELPQEKRIPTKNFWAAAVSGRVWCLSLIYFGVSTTMYGVTLWLPSVIRSFSGLSYFWTGAVAVIPFAITTAAMVLVGWHSDQKCERRWHTAVPAFTAAGCLAMAALVRSPVLIVGGIGLGLAAAEAMVGPFWAMATSQMVGISAAAGIAMINSLANLGGYFGPDIVGFFRGSDGSFRGGLLAIAGTILLSGGVALVIGKQRDHLRSNWRVET